MLLKFVKSHAKDMILNLVKCFPTYKIFCSAKFVKSHCKDLVSSF